jgi:hypothetical protein
MFTPLREVITPSAANIMTESRDNGQGGNDLYMHGIFIQGDKRNQNERVYPVNEITSAVKTLREKINSGFSVLGEADHPDDLNINIDRVSHAIVEMDMQGNDGIGKLKMLPTPMGNICKTLLENGVKLGVSSRGSGNVDGSGNVSDFEIVTVDIVANPSAPDAYPDAIYEQIMNHRRGGTFWDVAESVNHDYKAQKYLKEEMKRFIQDLGRR